MAAEHTRDEWLLLDDAGLLAACHVDTYRSSGPGGQHANKTSSAVRLRHIATGLAVVSEDTRSQHENKAKAIRRMRQAIALHVRLPLDAAWRLPEVFSGCVSKTGRIEVSRKNPNYVRIVAVVLDVVEDQAGRLRDAATKLKVSTGQLSRFVTGDGKVLDVVNRIRHAAGLRPLSPG